MASKKKKKLESAFGVLKDLKIPPKTKKRIPIPKKSLRCSKCGCIIEPDSMIVWSSKIGRLYNEGMQKMLEDLHFVGDKQFLCHKTRHFRQGGIWEYRTCGPLVENTPQADFVDWVTRRPTISER